MFLQKALLPFLFVALSFSTSPSFGTETVIVNKTFHGREIKIRVGGLIRIDLEELGSAGYVWEIQDLDKDHFDVVDVRTEGPPPSGDVTGKPIVKTWLIRAKKAGKAELKLLYHRPWESEKEAIERFFIRVRIL